MYQRIFLYILLLSPFALKAQIAVTSNPGPGLYVALNWPAVPGATGYNVFRKAPADPAYPGTPLNAQPIRPAATCAAIKALLIVGTDSTNWKRVSLALADSTVLFSPCLMNGALSASKQQRLAVVAGSSMPIAIAAGTGYEDHGVTSGTAYQYKIVAVGPGTTVATDLSVTAGVPTVLPSPTGLHAEAGDAENQVNWGSVSGAAGYTVERATSPGGPFTRVSPTYYMSTFTRHLNGDTLVPNALGFVDFQHDDTAGNPITHKVNGINIDGPANSTTYYYRVTALDFFLRPGTASAASGGVTPHDTTPPATPGNVATSVDNIHGWVEVSWTQVVKDIKGRVEQPDSSVTYKLYRFTGSGSPTVLTPAFVANVPAVKGIHGVDTVDKYSGLRAVYGDKTWWYRVRAVDIHGNIGPWSAAASAIVKDTTPPAIVKGVMAKGFEDHISVMWQLNTEPDMAQYTVYRSLCHLGQWVNCNQPDTCRSWYLGTPEYNTGVPGYNAQGSPAFVNNDRKGWPCPCSGTFVFLGTITQDSAKRARAAGHFMYNDYSVPPGSPLCYAYWVKAKDSSGNESGTWPIPSPAEQAQIVCAHLRDTTPPEAATITGLNALSSSILVQWIGPPSQDIRAYQVYRAQGLVPGQEPPIANFTWVGGMTVEIPPKIPVVLTAPYHAPAVLPCDSIPVQAMPWMSQGAFLDKNVLPKLTYWYRVVGIDYGGNQTPLSQAAPISTFTFTIKVIPAPVLDTALVNATPCSVGLKWTPSFNAAADKGFIVYRSTSATGTFNPIVTAPVQGNTYTDTQVTHGQTYYYKVALLLKTGQLSGLSNVKTITP
jgi:fibronectin type 3 domain-containing protein